MSVSAPHFLLAHRVANSLPRSCCQLAPPTRLSRPQIEFCLLQLQPPKKQCVLHPRAPCMPEYLQPPLVSCDVILLRCTSCRRLMTPWRVTWQPRQPLAVVALHKHQA